MHLRRPFADASSAVTLTLGIAGLAYNVDGLEISVPGTGLLGPFVPNVTWNPNP